MDTIHAEEIIHCECVYGGAKEKAQGATLTFETNLIDTKKKLSVWEYANHNNISRKLKLHFIDLGEIFHKLWFYLNEVLTSTLRTYIIHLCSGPLVHLKQKHNYYIYEKLKCNDHNVTMICFLVFIYARENNPQHNTLIKVLLPSRSFVSLCSQTWRPQRNVLHLPVPKTTTFIISCFSKISNTNQCFGS